MIPTTHYSTHISIQKSIIFKLWREHHHRHPTLPFPRHLPTDNFSLRFIRLCRGLFTPNDDEGSSGTLTFAGIFITICHFYGKLLFFKISATEAWPESLLKRIVFRCKFSAAGNRRDFQSHKFPFIIIVAGKKRRKRVQMGPKDNILFS